jgi:cell division protease FtsH
MLLPGATPGSGPTQELVDKEVRRIVDEAEDEVVELLRRERSRLDALASALLEKETLDQIEAYEVAGVPPAVAEAADAAPPAEPVGSNPPAL